MSTGLLNGIAQDKGTLIMMCNTSSHSRIASSSAKSWSIYVKGSSNVKIKSTMIWIEAIYSP